MTTSYADVDIEYETEFLEPDPVDPELVDDERAPASDEFVEQVTETARAKRYRLKTKHGLNFLLRVFAGNPATVSDAAAIIAHGPAVSKAVGQLADKEEKARKFIDFVTDDGLDNPYVITAVTVLPLLFQMMRNHEPALTKVGAGGIHLRIPFTKRRFRLPFSIKIRLFRGAREMTEEPESLTTHIFGNPAIRAALERQDIKIAWPVRQ